MTDRERAEEALVKAGYEFKIRGSQGGSWWTKGNEPPFTTVYVEPEERFRMNGNVTDLPSLLSPTLTEEERKALEWAICQCHPDRRFVSNRYLKPLLSILARLGGGQT